MPKRAPARRTVAPCLTMARRLATGKGKRTMTTLAEDYRMVRSGDPWGDCMGALFDIAEWLYVNDLDIPDEWEFRPSPMLGTHEPEYGAFGECVLSGIDTRAYRDVLDLGNKLFRLRGILIAAGKDY